MITVIIPCHNEELTIAKTIQELMNLEIGDLDIVVVDNASTDGTALIAKQCGARVVREPFKGKGRAFRKGLYCIDRSTSVIFLIDGDNTYGTESLPEATNLIKNEGYFMKW